jgi:hypothetical protein
VRAVGKFLPENKVEEIESRLKSLEKRPARQRGEEEDEGGWGVPQ